MAAPGGGEAPPPAVPFSYAQAAKRKSTPPSNPTQSQRPTSASSSQSPHDVPSVTSAMSTPEVKGTWADESTDPPTSVESRETRRVSSDSEQKRSASSVSISRDDTTKSVEARASALDISSQSLIPITKDEETAASPKVVSEDASTEIPRRANGVTDVDASTERSSSRGKSSERSDSKAPSKQLKDAPPPPINIWAQRAQDAKARQGSTHNQSKAPTMSPETPAIAEVERRSSSRDLGSRSDVQKAEGKNSTAQKNDGQGPQEGPPDRSQKDWSSRTENQQQSPTRPNQQKPAKSGPKQDRVSPQPALPVVRDAVSWPTPENAQDGERRKSQGKDKPEGDRVAPAPSKHGKNEWVTMSFTPSVKFNTPLPIPGKRGGRGGARGGRDGSGRGGMPANATDRAATSAGPTTVTESPTDPNQRHRGDASTAKPAPLPTKSRRPMNESLVLVQEQNEASQEAQQKQALRQDDISAAEQIAPNLTNSAEPTNLPTIQSTETSKFESSKDATKSSAADESTGVAASLPTLRAKSIGTIAEIPPFRQKNRTLPSRDSGAGKGGEDDDVRRNGTEMGSVDHSNGSKYPSTEKRQDTVTRAPDRSGESTVLPFRERGDGRPDRGRGGRNRPNGGHYQNSHSTNPQQFSNGHLPQIQTNHLYYPKNGPGVQSAYGSYSSQFSNSSRNVRSGPKSASIPNDGTYSRYSGNFPSPSAYPGSTPVMSAGYDYQMLPMGAVSYPPYFDQMMLVNTVAHQMSYYFSFDNLIKDMFLRRHMDSQGFVDLSLIANFKRMKDLTTDVDLIKYVSANSSDFELRQGADGKDKLRRRDDWERWVLNVEDRDPAAQNEGPLYAGQPHRNWVQSFDQAAMGRSPMSSVDMTAQQPHDGTSSPFQGVMMHPSFAPPAGASPTGSASRTPSRPNRYSLPVIESELYQTAQDPQTPRDGSSNEPIEEADSFPDEQIDSLTVVVQEAAHSPVRPAAHSLASRTFSNGSIDAQSIPDDSRRTEEEATAPSPRPNGTLEGVRASNLTLSGRRLASTSPSSRVPSETSVGTFWIKGKGEGPVPLPDGSSNEPYSHLRMKAFQQRQSARPGHCPYDMDILYKFWSHFLIRNFNTKMYNEFRQMAHEDYQTNSINTGIDMLIQYYSEALSSQQTIRDRIARHYVELVKAEDPAKDRPAFRKLRMAWRDGALNFKNRIKIRDQMDPELRDALDR